MANKLTPWFPPDIKPARVGVYEVHIPNDTVWCYWDGAHWGWYTGVFYRAASGTNRYEVVSGVYPRQSKKWRGLTKKAKANA